MPYDPVRDADVAPSPGRGPSESPGPSPHLTPAMLRQPHAPLSDRELTTVDRPRYPPAFQEPAVRYRSPSQQLQYTQHPNHGSYTPSAPGQPLPYSNGPSHMQYESAYSEHHSGAGVLMRPTGNPRGGLGDLLNGPSEEGEGGAYGRPRSSSGAPGVRNSATPVPDDPSRPSSIGGGMQGDVSATFHHSSQAGKRPSAEKRGNSISMLLNAGPSPLGTAAGNTTRDRPTTPHYPPRVTRSPSTDRSTVPDVPSPGSSHLPMAATKHRDHPSPGSSGNNFSQAAPLLQGEAMSNDEQQSNRIGWINSFGQSRQPGEDAAVAEKPFNPAQRLISPNRNITSPRASLANGSEEDASHDRRRSTVVGWTGISNAEASPRASMDAGRSSIGGSSGNSRASISSVQGYDPPHALGSAMAQSLPRHMDGRHASIQGSGTRSSSSGPYGSELPTNDPSVGYGPITPSVHQVDLASPPRTTPAVLDGFTSVEPPQRQRKKSKRDLAKEAKDASVAAAQLEGDTRPSNGADASAGKQEAHTGESTTSTGIAASGTQPIKPRAPAKRKHSGNMVKPDAPAVKPRSRGRPRKNSSLATEEPTRDVVDRVPATESPARTVATPQSLPYHPLHRISPATSLLVPLTPSEAAYLRDPLNSRNPLKRAFLAARGVQGLNIDAGSNLSGTERTDGYLQGRMGPGAKRPREEDMQDPNNSFGWTSDAPKRARQQSPPHSHKDPASHYNARPNVGRDAREDSKIVGLKKFNNWVKSVTIKKFTRRRPGTQQEPTRTGQRRDGQRFKPNGRVLDMGCGKGGDMAKWDKADIAELVGVDVASKSIQDYKDRLGSLRQPMCYETSLHVLDCFSSALETVLSPEQLEPLFDNVSSQFCIHYAFRSEENVRIMLGNVSRHLRVGGTFFGTTVSSTKLIDYLSQVPEDADELTIGNEYFKITFEEREHEGPFGHAYTFYLEDAIDDCVEYLVDWERFVEIAKEFKLECVYREDFDVFYEQQRQVPEYALMAERMGVSKGGMMFMDAEQWEAATIYLAFAFERLE